MATITQDMRYRLSLIKYAEKYDVSNAAIKYKTNRQYIYRRKRRFDGSIESLRDSSTFLFWGCHQVFYADKGIILQLLSFLQVL